MEKVSLSIFICCTFLVYSCSSMRNLREVSSTRHLQKVSSLRFKALSSEGTSIRTDGYYRSNNRNPFGIGTEVLVFYDNGSVAQFFINQEKQNHPITDFNQVLLRRNKNSDGAKSVGLYQIGHDTLYVNLYRKDLISGLEIYRYYFRMINSDSLFCFRIDAPQQVFDGRIVVRDEKSGYKFITASNLQKPNDHFLRKREWMWENISEWEKYMNTYSPRK